MSEITIAQDSKLIKVLAAQARHESVDSDAATEASAIISELAQDLNPQNRHQIAQTVAFTVNELQQGSLDFLNQIADIKNIGYGDKAAFNVKTEGIKAFFQAKGSTTPRTMVAGRQILVGTEEVSARPAISLMDLRTGRVQMADLIREANREMTNAKLTKIESVLQAAISTKASPFFATSAGGKVTAASLDPQLQYFRRLGNVTILGDMAATSQLADLTGMAMSNSLNQHSDSQIDEFNNNGFIGRYKGCPVANMNNAYYSGTTTPILGTNWLYLIPGAVSPDMRNLKVVNEGSIQAVDAQDINDLVYEIRLDQWFGAAFVVGTQPTIGAHRIDS